VHYENPKVVVGCIPVWADRVLFCRRAIEPRYGKWTIPAGFLENGETVQEGAIRETHEECGAVVEALKPHALFSLPFISQIYVIFRGPLATPRFEAGAESLEVELFKEQEVPWDELAFPVIKKALRLFYDDLSAGAFSFHIGEIRNRPVR
jgi:ADP-ribose pyrophosphatase YjhB (NUDIX family)